MEFIPPNQTVVLKCLKDGTEFSQLRDFVLKITPSAFKIRIAKDNLKAPEGYGSIAYVNYASQPLAQASKIKLDAAIAASKSFSKRQGCLDLSKCVTFLKDEGYKPAIHYPIWIGNIVNEDSEDLRTFFSGFGTLNTDSAFPAIRIFEGEHRSAIINYASFTSAIAAAEACNSRSVTFGNEMVGKMYATAQLRDTTKFVEDLRNLLRNSSQGSIGYAEVEKLATENGVKVSLWWNILMQNNDIFTLNDSRSLVSLKYAHESFGLEPASESTRAPASSAVYAAAAVSKPSETVPTRASFSSAVYAPPATAAAVPKTETVPTRAPSSSAVYAPPAAAAPVPRASETGPPRPSVPRVTETGPARPPVTSYATAPPPTAPTWDNSSASDGQSRCARENSTPEPQLEDGLEKEDSGDVTLDPITMEVMRDPVIAADGYTYERVTIEAWIRRHGPVSMITLTPLRHAFLTPNKAVRDLIMSRHPGVKLAPFNP